MIPLLTSYNSAIVPLKIYHIPDGMLFKLYDDRDRTYVAGQRDDRITGAGQETGVMSRSQLLSRLPKTIVRNGEIITIRSDINERLAQSKVEPSSNTSFDVTGLSLASYRSSSASESSGRGGDREAQSKLSSEAAVRRLAATTSGVNSCAYNSQDTNDERKKTENLLDCKSSYDDEKENQLAGTLTTTQGVSKSSYSKRNDCAQIPPATTTHSSKVFKTEAVRGTERDVIYLDTPAVVAVAGLIRGADEMPDTTLQGVNSSPNTTTIQVRWLDGKKTIVAKMWETDLVGTLKELLIKHFSDAGGCPEFQLRTAYPPTNISDSITMQV